MTENNKSEPVEMQPVQIDIVPAKRVPSAPSIKVKVMLNSEIAQHIIHRAYKQYSIDLYALDVTARNQAMDNVAELVDAIVYRERARLEGAIQKEIEQADAVLQAKGIDELPFYENAVEAILNKTSPRCSDLIELVKLLDQLIMRLEAIWLGDDIADPDERKASEGEHYRIRRGWERQVFKFTGAYRFYADRVRQYKKRLRSSHDGSEPRPLIYIFTESAPFLSHLDDQTQKAVQEGLEAYRLSVDHDDKDLLQQDGILKKKRQAVVSKSSERPADLHRYPFEKGDNSQDQAAAESTLKTVQGGD